MSPAEAAPPSPADRCLHEPSSICASAGWNNLEHGTVSPHPDLLSADPLRAQPNLREWTWRADRPRSSPSSVSSFSQFLLGSGRFWRWFSLVMLVRVFTQTSNESRADEGGRIELNMLRFPMFCLPFPLNCTFKNMSPYIEPTIIFKLSQSK